MKKRIISLSFCLVLAAYSACFEVPVNAEAVKITNLNDGDIIYCEDLDAAAVEAGGRCSLFDNGVLIGEDDTEPYLFDISGLALGDHILKAVADNGYDEIHISIYDQNLAEKVYYDFEDTDGLYDFKGLEKTGFYGIGAVDDIHGGSLMIGRDETYAQKVEEGQSGEAFLDRTLGYDIATIESDFYLSSTEGTFEILLREGNKQQTVGQFVGNQFKIRNVSGGLAGTINGIAANEWYHMVMNINTVTDTYDVTLTSEDGTQKGGKLSAPLNSAFGKTSVYRLNVGKTNAEMYLAMDNYSVKVMEDVPVISGFGNDGNMADDRRINSMQKAFDVFMTGGIKEITPEMISVADEDNEYIIDSVSLSPDGKVITVELGEWLESDKTCYVHIDGNVESETGRLGRDVVSFFKSYDDGMSVKILDVEDNAFMNAETFKSLRVNAISKEVESIVLYDNDEEFAFCYEAPYVFDVSRLGLGEHELNVVLTDIYGQSVSDSVTVTIYNQMFSVKSKEDFEEYAGGRPDGFGGWENLGFYRAGRVDSEHGNSLVLGIDDTYAEKMAQGSSGGAFISKDDLQERQFAIEFDFLMSGIVGAYNMELRSANGNQTIINIIDNEIRIRDLSGNTTGSIAGIYVNQWYKLRLYADVAEHLYTVELYNENGMRMGSVLQGELKTLIEPKTAFRLYGPSTGAECEMYIDNFSVYRVNTIPYIVGYGNNSIMSSDNTVKNDLNGFDVFLSDEVTADSVSADKVHLYDGKKEISVKNVIVSDNRKSFAVIPASKLKPDKTYKLIIDKTVKNAQNIESGSDTTGFFKTAHGELYVSNASFNGSLFSADVHNSMNEEKLVYFVVSVFKNSRLEKSRIEKYNAGAGVTEFMTDIEELNDGRRVEIYAWDSLSAPISLYEGDIASK